MPDLEQHEEDEWHEEGDESRGVDWDLHRCSFSTMSYRRSMVWAYDVLPVLLVGEMSECQSGLPDLIPPQVLLLTG